MPTVPVLALGTYYTTTAPSPAANAHAMRQLCWWAKNDPSKANYPFEFPTGPGQGVTIRTPTDAYDYIAQRIHERVPWMRHYFRIGNRPLVIVPIPSSSVTLENYWTARWSGREIGQRLEAQKAGRLALTLVNRQQLPKKHEGAKLSLDELRRQLVFSPARPRSDEAILYVDDVLTWGRHLWAVHSCLGSPPGACGVVIATTDAAPCADALEARARLVSARGSEVSIDELEFKS